MKSEIATNLKKYEIHWLRHVQMNLLNHLKKIEFANQLISVQIKFAPSIESSLNFYWNELTKVEFVVWLIDRCHVLRL